MRHVVSTLQSEWHILPYLIAWLYLHLSPLSWHVWVSLYSIPLRSYYPLQDRLNVSTWILSTSSADNSGCCRPLLSLKTYFCCLAHWGQSYWGENGYRYKSLFHIDLLSWFFTALFFFLRIWDHFPQKQDFLACSSLKPQHRMKAGFKMHEAGIHEGILIIWSSHHSKKTFLPAHNQ